MGNPIKAVEVRVPEAPDKTPEFAREWVSELGEFKPVDQTGGLRSATEDAVRLGDSRPPDAPLPASVIEAFRPLKQLLAAQAKPAPVPAISGKDVRATLVRLQRTVSARGGETASRFLKPVVQTIDRVDAAAPQGPRFVANDRIREALAPSIQWIEDYTARLQGGKATFFDSILLASHIAIINMSL